MRYFVKSQGSTSQIITTSLTIAQSVYCGRHAKALSKCPEDLVSRTMNLSFQLTWSVGQRAKKSHVMEHISVLNTAFSKAYSIATLCSYNRGPHSNGADSAARLFVVPHSSSSKNLYANRKSAFRRFIHVLS